MKPTDAVGLTLGALCVIVLVFIIGASFQATWTCRNALARARDSRDSITVFRLEVCETK